MSTRAEILNGADFEGYEDFCADVVNAIKNHYRVSDPCVNMVARQPGEILSDPDDDKLYHVGGESGYPCDEILQATRSCEVIPEFQGIDFYHDCASPYYQRIVGSDAEGLAGADLRIGLDESLRQLNIMDRGDLGVDLGLAADNSPTLRIWHPNANVALSLQFGSIFCQTNLLMQASDFLFSGRVDRSSGNLFTFNSGAGDELTDTNAEQAWMYIEPKINQTLTAGYVAVLVDVTETSLGDGSAGAGYNALLDLRVAGTTQFGIQNGGQIMTNQVEAGAIGAYDRRIPIYDETGSLEGYVALYAAP